MVQTRRIELKTKGHCDIIDITHQVAQEVAQTGMKDGTVTIFVPGSTGGVTTVEYESGLLSDLRGLFDRVVPTDIPYQHDRRWGDGNGHAHVRATLQGPSFAFPVAGGRPVLGTWQQIILMDYDNRPRSREVSITVVGE